MVATRIRKASRLAKPPAKWGMGRGRRPPPGATESEVGSRHGAPRPGTTGFVRPLFGSPQGQYLSAQKLGTYHRHLPEIRNPAPNVGRNSRRALAPPGDTARARQEVADPALGQRE